MNYCRYCGNTELLDPNIYEIPGFACGTYANAPRPGGRKCWEGYFIKSQAELAALKKRIEEAEEMKEIIRILAPAVSKEARLYPGGKWEELNKRIRALPTNKEKP